MSDPLVVSFATQLDELEQFIYFQWAWSSPEAGFALYVYHAGGEKGPLPDITPEFWCDLGAVRHTPTLAAYGYLLTLQSQSSSQHHTEWASALEHVTVRDPFPLDRQAFTFRPLDMLGIALGTTRCDVVHQETQSRLMQIIPRLALEGNHDAWSVGLYGLAAHLLGLPWSKLLFPPFDAMPADVLALLKWMTVAYESAPSTTAMTHYINDIDLTLLKKCGLGRLQPGDIGRAALMHFALRRTVSERIESQVRATWSVNRATQDAVIIVEQLCRRFPLFARQLQQRRRDEREAGKKERGERPTIAMRDEYDIQDALHAILKLYFDDVRKEVWTPSYAASQNRMDFVLKREKIVIETKFMGAKLTQGEVTRQLTIDEKYYRQDLDCQTLICFVYDPECRCDNPTALENDVNLDEGDFRVIVIVSLVG
jgi:hypothetical protein